MRLSEIVVKSRFRKDNGKLSTLAESMKSIGLLHPIVVTPTAHLIAGYRRLEAARLLGWEEIPVTVVDLADMVRGEHDENVERKDFLPSEMVAIAEALAPVEKQAAKKRRTANLPSQTEKFSASEQARALDKVAAAAGVSRPTLTKATEVVNAAKANPKKFGKLVEKMDATGKVDGAYKALQRMKAADEINAEPPPLPEGPFRVIVVDPPWTYRNRAEDVTHRAANPYPSMTTEEICKLPIGALATQDAILWLWTTNAHLREAFTVAEMWGFEYKTMLTWFKDSMGTGDWLRGQTEHCLMCVKGKPTVLLTNQTTAIRGPIRQHSRKPDEFYEMVDALCPGSKVELFTRTARQGWAAHGNDTAQF